MPAHRHVHHRPPEPTADELACARWEDDGGAARVPAPSHEAREAAWLRVSAELTGRFPAIGGRDDVIVTCEDTTRSGAPALFLPTLAQVEVARAVFAPHAPGTLRPAVFGDEDRYPAAWGAFVHEAAHAAHSRWTPAPGHDGTAAADAAAMLEESRVERAHLTRRPGDRPYLRAVVRDLVMGDMGTRPPDTAWSAAFAAGLILARRDAGVLDPGEAAPVEHTATAILGEPLLTTLAGIWAAAHQVADHDGDTMLDLGLAWCQALDARPDQPEPPAEDGAPTGGITAAIGATAARVAAAEKARRAAEAAEDAAYARAATSRVKARNDQAARTRRAADLAKAVFAPDAGPVDPASPGRTRRLLPSPVLGTRTPTTAEKTAAGRLARGLRAAAYRERVETRTPSATPPGRLNMRAALAHDAQRAAGATPTALPWTGTRRRATPTPPLRVGIAVDVSGSMKRATDPVSSAAWILAKATAMTDPDSRTATIAYDRHLTAVTRPGRTPQRPTRFDATGGGHALAETIDALDAALELTRRGAGRLLVIASDGLYSREETAAAAGRVLALAASGCAVLHLHFGGFGPRTIPGAALLELTDPATAADAIARAAVAQVAATR
ncbi:VWA domain-containing protein [Streptomycetaceae bacterium NBC_01309]